MRWRARYAVTGHRPRKRFGQHFLHDQRVIARIVDAIDPRAGEHIVEIGPGTGALTRPLLERTGALEAIEIDRDLAPRLTETLAAAGRLTLHTMDALDVDLSALAGLGKLRLVGNLPYNIATPLLFHAYAHADRIEDLVFMLQKEVADRLAAKPGGKDYGRLSVMIQWRFTVERLFDVGTGAFTPPPKVESTVVRLVPHPPELSLHDPLLFGRIVQAAFGQRRKTLRNALKELVTPEQLRAAGIDPQRRAETLAPVEFARLANLVG